MLTSLLFFVTTTDLSRDICGRMNQSSVEPHQEVLHEVRYSMFADVCKLNLSN